MLSGDSDTRGTIASMNAMVQEVEEHTRDGEYYLSRIESSAFFRLETEVGRLPELINTSSFV